MWHQLQDKLTRTITFMQMAAPVHPVSLVQVVVKNVIGIAQGPTVQLVTVFNVHHAIF